MLGLFALAVLLFGGAMGARAEVKTIDCGKGNVMVSVSDEGGRPCYSVKLNGETFVERSPLGLKLDCADLTQGLTLTGMDSRKIEDHYALSTIKKSLVDYNANEGTFHFSQDGKPALDIVFRVSDHDVAFRYQVLARKVSAAVVESEATGFVMPQGSTTFLCPQMKPMTGFARTAPSYETHYAFDEAMGTNGWGQGFTLPCLFRNGNKGWTLISETGTDGSYVGCRLDNAGGNAYRIGFPLKEEMNGMGSTGAAVSLPFATPWRTITVGQTLSPIVETTVATDVVSPKYKASRRYDYGKGTWSWIIGDDASCTFDEQKRYIDFAAAMGYRSVLIDAQWDKMIGYDRMGELARYGSERGVGIFLWYNSNGLWNDAPQSPQHKMSTSAARRKEMQWMKDNGILGIKVDFFGGDKQPMMQLYEDILTDANDFGLQVIFHGCTLPRGWERMYPNYVSSEAVRASENLRFGQGECNDEAKNASALPFIRNAVGSMDFGGSTLNKYYSASNARGTHRVTSDVFALATAVLFQSSVQHFAMAPNNLTDAPGWAIEFMKDVPTTWDETRFIEGYPGKYVILARRSGNQWYVAGINATDKPIATTLNLNFTDGGNAVVFADDSELKGGVSTVKMGKKSTLAVTIPTNGGLVVVANAADDGTAMNPVLFSDVPDIDIIRVGDTYYMVSTTMHFSPGCGIMKSKDLAHWTLCNYTHDILDNNDRFFLKNGKNEYSNGSWAANLRYDRYQKMYYMIVTCNTTGKTYFFVTDDIEHGQWHKSITDKCYDPGLLFEDTGKEIKKYVIHPSDKMNDYGVLLREMHVDKDWNVTVGKPERIIEYSQMEKPARGLRAEGYHAYKIGDYYYIFMIEFADGMRKEIVWRSRDLHGQWEGRDAFCGEMIGDNGEIALPHNGIAQGGVVQAKDGRWWCFLFKDYGSVGRMPVVLPMKWGEDGWPVIGHDNTSTPQRIDLAAKGYKPEGNIVESDEFDLWTPAKSRSRFGGHQPGIKLFWQWNHVPDNEGWSLTERKGWLRLRTNSLAHSIRDARNTLTQRTMGPTCAGWTLMDVSQMNDGDCAGLSAFQRRFGFVGVEKTGGKLYLVMRKSDNVKDPIGKEYARIALNQTKVWLRADFNFTNRTDKAWFSYSLDGEHFLPIGNTLQMHYDMPDFTGYRFALFNYSTQTTGGTVDFDYFHVK